MIRKNKGYTLVEVMVVVAILSIITAFALPAYNEQARKGRRSDGQAALMEVASRMESFYFTNRTYTTDMTDLGYSLASANPTPEQHYTLGVNAATATCPIATCFELQATAVGGQVDDGNLTLDSRGRRLPADRW